MSEKKWWRLASNVPCSNSPSDRAARLQMFRNMDCNGNGFLSLREVERYLEKTLGATQLGEVHEAVVAAFEGAKGLRRSRDQHA